MRTITLKDIVNIIFRRLPFVIIIPLITMVAVAYINYEVLEPMYVANTSLYIFNANKEEISTQDLSVGLQLIADYREIATSNRVKLATAEKLGVLDIKGYTIGVNSINDSRVLGISITGPDPQVAANIANALANEFAECVTEMLKVDNVSVIDPAEPPTAPSSPKKAQNIVISGLVALVVVIGIAIVVDMSNNTVRTVEDIEEILKLPVLARIPKTEEKAK